MSNPHADFEAFLPEDSRAEARLRSAGLRRSGVLAQYRPLLFATRLSQPANGRFYAQLVDLLERYTARVFLIARFRSHTGQTKLFRQAHDLYSGKDPEHILADIQADIWGYAPDERLKDVMKSTTEDWYRRPLHKYFLYEYERSLLAEGEDLPSLETFTRNTLKSQRTTEHILPQNPDREASCWWSRFTNEEHLALRHTIGNLTLTLDNSSYSNKCFVDKRGEPLKPGREPRRCYSQGKLHQERLLAQYDDWTPDSIRARQEELTTFALDRWEVERPEREVESVAVVETDEFVDEDLGEF